MQYCKGVRDVVESHLRLLCTGLLRIAFVVVVIFVLLIMYGLYRQHEREREERIYLHGLLKNWPSSSFINRTSNNIPSHMTFYKTLPSKETKP